MRKRLCDFNDKHLGETIYIIGCAPTLANLTQEEIEFLEQKITIGVNFSHLKINLKYWIGGHIEQVAFAIESDLSHSTPLFAHYGNHTKYMTQIWNNERVVPVDDLFPKLPLSRYVDKNQNLYGSTSIVLSATHLAYIMGASKIVYVGFEGKSALHFYTIDKHMERNTIRKIQNILMSRKYWSEINYNHPSPHLNVHRAFEIMLDGDSQYGHFGKKEDLSRRPLTYFGKDQHGIRNRNDIKEYISFLNKSGVRTFTLKSEEMMVDAACTVVDNVRSVL